LIDDSNMGPAGAGDVWLVRHTETDWNLSRRYQSHSDRPLTPRGNTQLRQVVEFFRGAQVATIVSTGLARTDSLAAAIAAEQNGAQHVIDRRWMEIEHGCWEGLTYDEVKARFGDRAEDRFRDPCGSRVHAGETLTELAGRVLASWRDLPRSTRGGCVVVTHATPIQVLLSRTIGVAEERYWRIHVDLGSVSHLRVEAGKASVQFLNRVLVP
jgi:alpha-ribazole phosphatase